MHPRTRRLIEGRLLTTQELSRLVGVPAVTVQKWAERGLVDFVLKGRTYLFDRNDFRDPDRLPGRASARQGRPSVQGRRSPAYGGPQRDQGQRKPT